MKDEDLRDIERFVTRWDVEETIRRYGETKRVQLPAWLVSPRTEREFILGVSLLVHHLLQANDDEELFVPTFEDEGDDARFTGWSHGGPRRRWQPSDGLPGSAEGGLEPGARRMRHARVDKEAQ